MPAVRVNFVAADNRAESLGVAIVVDGEILQAVEVLQIKGHRPLRTVDLERILVLPAGREASGL